MKTLFHRVHQKRQAALATREKLHSDVVQLVEKYGGSIQEYRYDELHFGNMLVIVCFHGRLYRFILDRGLAFCEIADEQYPGKWQYFNDTADSHDFLATLECVLKMLS